jgi:hypothetical protein
MRVALLVLRLIRKSIQQTRRFQFAAIRFCRAFSFAPVTKRVSPMERICAQIHDVFAVFDRPLTEILEDVGRLSVRLVYAGCGEGILILGPL